jgi:hypothetical protein
MNSIDYIHDKGWYHDLKDGEGQVVGVAVFDKGFPPHDCEAGITCLFLSKFHVYDSYTSDNIVYRILLLRLSQDTSGLGEPCSYERVGVGLIWSGDDRKRPTWFEGAKEHKIDLFDLALVRTLLCAHLH